MAITPLSTPAAASPDVDSRAAAATMAQALSLDYGPTTPAHGMTVRLMTFHGHQHPAYMASGSQRQAANERRDPSTAATTKEKARRQTWKPAPHDGPTRREHPGKPGSRRRQRYDNSHFVGHPWAILSPEDLPAPGYPHDAPGFHFTEHAQLAMTAPDASPIHGRYEPRSRPAARHGLTPGDRALRQAVRRRQVPRGLVRRVEATIRRFLSGEDTRSEAWMLLEEEDVAEQREEQEGVVSDVDESMVLVCEADVREQWAEEHEEEPLTVTSKRRLVWRGSDGLSRLVVHSVCRHYRLHSYSKDARDGARLTYIERRPETTMPVGTTSFYDALFASTIEHR
ncbi:hypothetical protein SYNPS1DRAFT_29847 [Syncephalis pseudoplumigaleata]|uniref:R3H-associated N-terminal domain-containing protein n=1 Tax=Syncephalis pseudoplumigaleata TaxID=1712513 RepID=A0A4P9YWZ4_9FUNG|nr:hypothetical protein SYNPS1DRAFT_29847 [Syncephalis pseudoplumigaleata]|eukprot:RKP24385.1 hypothetical protein SYNPS1DRAFT_29847 [Syncephalis pseudoplumigaleata]